MRFTTTIAASLALLTRLASADFDVYAGTTNSVGEGHFAETWYIFQGEPNCNDAWNAKEYYESDDVSGKYRTGFRCEGKGCWGTNNPGDIEELEMHFSNNPLFHWTIYKNRGYPYKLFGVNGEVQGECHSFAGDDFGCPVVAPWPGQRSGVRKLRCYTRASAAEIQNAK
ncbi:hypothetical protein OQA88_9173 [Cercophora sp. LCS_1]